MYKLILLLFLILSPILPTWAINTDVLVIGGGTSGIAAGIQSARLGVRTLILEETEWLGGMLTSAGVSAVDGNYKLPAGIWGEFLQQLAIHYGGLDSLKTGWVSNVLFEPSVGNRIFHEMANKEPLLTVQKGYSVRNIEKVKKQWKITAIAKDRKIQVIYAYILIDATELGDIAKMCGVKYDIGMDSRLTTHEDIAPLKSNHIIQDLTYVAILKDYGRDVSISRPANYNPTIFACCCNNILCKTPKEPKRIWSKEMMLSYGRLPNSKYMINWPIEGNDFYTNLIDSDSLGRVRAIAQAKHHTMCFIYFIQHELGYNTLGLADDEFPTIDKLPFIPYYRESRRIHGKVRFTLNHITSPYNQTDKLYRINIAVGDYPVDHHHTRYTGYETLPDLHFYPVPSFGLPLGTLIPEDVDGLIVAEKSISVSNIVNGTTRLQPVIMQIGQAAGIMAGLAVKGHRKIRDVSVRRVQEAVLNANGYLMPYLDVPVNSPLFKSYQRIGVTGILKGVGKTVDWSNQTWFRADTILLKSDLRGLSDVYPYVGRFFEYSDSSISIQEFLNLLKAIAHEEHLRHIDVVTFAKRIWKKYNLNNFSLERSVLRGEAAILLDTILNPFYRKEVNIRGQFE